MSDLGEVGLRIFGGDGISDGDQPTAHFTHTLGIAVGVMSLSSYWGPVGSAPPLGLAWNTYSQIVTGSPLGGPHREGPNGLPGYLWVA